jgi:hypothetical protein
MNGGIAVLFCTAPILLRVEISGTCEPCVECSFSEFPWRTFSSRPRIGQVSPNTSPRKAQSSELPVREESATRIQGSASVSMTSGPTRSSFATGVSIGKRLPSTSQPSCGGRQWSRGGVARGIRRAAVVELPIVSAMTHSTASTAESKKCQRGNAEPQPDPVTAEPFHNEPPSLIGAADVGRGIDASAVGEPI